MSKKVFLLITVVLVLGLFGNALAVPPSVAHEWTFDGDAQDSSGNNNHGTMTGFPVPPDPCFVAGTPNKPGGNLALNFDGSNDTVDNITASGLPTSQYDPWSMNVWLYIPSGSSIAGPYRGICGWGNYSSGLKCRFLSIANGGDICFR